MSTTELAAAVNAGADLALKPAQKAEALIVRIADAIKASLPADGAMFQRFKAAAALAVAQKPDIAADIPSFLIACRKCAQDGLLPDGRQAALVVYKTKGKDGRYTPTVQYQPMVFGLVELARRSEEIRELRVRSVYAGDTFRHTFGDSECITHEPPALGQPRGEFVGAYAIAVLRSGGIERDVMAKGEIDAIRAVSKAKDSGPWVDWYDRMAEKTVLRRLLKRLPRPDQLDSAIRHDEENDALLDVTPPPITPGVSKLDALAGRKPVPAPIEDADVVDAPPSKADALATAKDAASRGATAQELWPILEAAGCAESAIADLVAEMMDGRP